MHLPYVILMMAYMLYFGSNILHHPQDLNTNSEEFYSFLDTSHHNNHSIHFSGDIQSSKVYADGKLNSPNQYFWKDLHIPVHCVYMLPAWNLHLDSNIFSRPPPAFKLA